MPRSQGFQFLPRLPGYARTSQARGSGFRTKLLTQEWIPGPDFSDYNCSVVLLVAFRQWALPKLSFFYSDVFLSSAVTVAATTDCSSDCQPGALPSLTLPSHCPFDQEAIHERVHGIYGICRLMDLSRPLQIFCVHMFVALDPVCAVSRGYRLVLGLLLRRLHVSTICWIMGLQAHVRQQRGSWAVVVI